MLRRAAESELAAGRIDNAAALSRDALVRSPFDVRALRVLGLTEARARREDAADDILTLAGNWSLRDDPTHAWLVERRLRRGDYASSFAHADTLVRRREDIQPQVFQLFTLAAAEDPQRSLPVVARLLAADPPWRTAYLASLNHTPQGLQVAANLALLLEAGRTPFTNDELQRLYSALNHVGGIGSIQTVRGRLNRPPLDTAVTNGGFDETDHPGPFQWRLYEKAGIVAEIVADDLRPSNPALRVDYDGYATGTIVEQLTYLTPGSYRFTAVVRSETGSPPARLAWTLSCATGGGDKASIPTGISGAAANTWVNLSGRFEVPAACTAQWLRLETRADDRRTPSSVWFDQIAISPVG
ncbi:tetratricopeptide repeat protein [Brevundimonas sp.]|uniref:tetratricopeptide repeat protein n=1 Tax=Brevundimonas sp. TaxID=1871086 RepID=UPI003F6EE40C